MGSIRNETAGDLHDPYGPVHRAGIEGAEIFHQSTEEFFKLVGQRVLAEVARHVRLPRMRLSRIATLWAAAAALIVGVASAQARRTLDRNDPEAQLMDYYAAVMQFTPIGLPDSSGRLEIGGSASLIPSISQADRTAGFGGTKIENTNLCPVYPRLTASKFFGRTGVELGFTPPVTVCGAKASVFALAIGRRFRLGQTWDGYARLSGLSGNIDVSTTCNAAAVADTLDQTCYGGSVSKDKVSPFSAAIELDAAYQGWRRNRLEPYFAAGLRYDAINFDVNYTRDSAQSLADAVAGHALPPLDDHNRLRATITRVHLAVGIAWELSRLIHLGGELYYAPGALMTLRGRAAIAL